MAKQEVQVQESMKALGTIRTLIEGSKDLKIIENEASTGYSFFAGKKRLCKLLKTKRGISLELNVKLPASFSKDLEGMETISAAVAHKKHLGTMKHLYKSGTDTKVKEIMEQALQVFAQELKPKEEEKIKEAK